jgi:succinoglycan biosynthesis transport protein ExoP
MAESRVSEFEQLKRHLLVIWRGRYWVLGIWLAGIVVAGAAVLVLPNVYASSTMILVERQKVPEAYVRSTVTEGMQERLKTITQQILSRTQIRQVIEEYDLLDEPGIKERVLQRLRFSEVPWLWAWFQKLGWVRDPSDEPSMDSAIRRFRQRVRIEVVGKQAFSVTYKGYDPVMVMRVTNAMAGMFISENLKLREALVSGTTQFLDTQLDEARQSLEKTEAELQSFQARNLGLLPEQLDANLRTLDRLQLDLQHADESLNSMAQQRAFLQRQIVQVEQQFADSGTPPPSLGQDLLSQRLARAESRLAELKLKYTDAYPEVASLKAEIKDLRSQIASRPESDAADLAANASLPMVADLARQIKQIDRDTVTLRAKRDRMNEDFLEYQRRVEGTPKVEQELQKLRRNYAIMQGNYASLLEKQMNAKLAESLESRQKGEQFRVIDPANLPSIPVSPNRKTLLMLGALGGLLGGVGLVLGMDILRPRFHTREDIGAVLGLPVLATVPKVRGAARGS